MSTMGSGASRPYITGFVLSLLLTIAAYLMVTNHTLNGRVLVGAVISLAIIQLLVQLLFFLHLGRESRPRWNLLVFTFMLGVLMILVFGSLWIMQNLNYHVIPQDTNTHILKDEGIYK